MRVNFNSISASVLECTFVCILLILQAALLGYSATRHSPTDLEPSILVSGISNWKYGRFDFFRVNPPLVRMVAAIPVLAVGCDSGWTDYDYAPGQRPEFTVKRWFLKRNRAIAIPLFIYARWACIPFSMIGAYFAYRWAKELYGHNSGIVTLILYIFEPNLLAHGELITPEAATVAFGIVAGYSYWRWLKHPSCTRAILAGAALGLAELSKMSWLVFFGLWPALWCLWRWIGSRHQLNIGIQETMKVKRGVLEPGGDSLTPILSQVGREEAVRGSALSKITLVAVRASELSTLPGDSGQMSDEANSDIKGLIVKTRPPFRQLALILLLSVYIINCGYAFDGFGTPLGEFLFVSKTFTGLDKSGLQGNRFRDCWMGNLPVPFPMQYVLGIDCQKKDLEEYYLPSYLRGEVKKHGGWWYYYLYGLLVKVPCGTWGILAVVVLLRTVRRCRPASLRDELVLLVPALVLLAVASSQTEFNRHLRYVFPALGLFLVFLGQSGADLTRRFSLIGVIIFALLAESVISLAVVYPHHLAYFNAFAGGSQNGYRHLTGSSLDWGQDLLYLRDHVKTTGQIVMELRDSDMSIELAREVIPNFGSKSAVGQRIIVVSPNCVEKGIPFPPPDGEMLTPTLWIIKQNY